MPLWNIMSVLFLKEQMTGQWCSCITQPRCSLHVEAGALVCSPVGLGLISARTKTLDSLSTSCSHRMQLIVGGGMHCSANTHWTLSCEKLNDLKMWRGLPCCFELMSLQLLTETPLKSRHACLRSDPQMFAWHNSDSPNGWPPHYSLTNSEAPWAASSHRVTMPAIKGHKTTGDVTSHPMSSLRWFDLWQVFCWDPVLLLKVFVLRPSQWSSRLCDHVV